LKQAKSGTGWKRVPLFRRKTGTFGEPQTLKCFGTSRTSLLEFPSTEMNLLDPSTETDAQGTRSAKPNLFWRLAALILLGLIFVVCLLTATNPVCWEFS
jgi:hypothetical protein